MDGFKRFTPAVDPKVLLFLAGAMWIGVGIMLLRLSVSWLFPEPAGTGIAFGLTGTAAGLAIHRYGFSKIAGKNIRRIRSADGKRCVFAFMPWRSYLIIIVMVTLGITLRHSSIPRTWLSLIYTGIGLALGLSGTLYFREIHKKPVRSSKSEPPVDPDGETPGR